MARTDSSRPWPVVPAASAHVHGYALAVHRSLPAFSRRFAALSLSLALTSAACSNRGADPTPVTPTAPTPSVSGSATCPAAPSVVDDPEDWTPSSTSPDVIPVLINGIVACGPNRILFTLLDGQNRPIGSPDRTASIALYDLGRDPTTAVTTVGGTFVWAIENERGIYVANATLPESGLYGVEFRTTAAGGQAVTARLTFDVQPSSDVVKVGDKAPASKTPTLADVGGDPTHISTDATPDPALYTTSVDAALAGDKPFVLIFATPKFCTSAQCGPTLDRLKPFVQRYPGVTFINVEPYKLKLVDGVLQADLDANNQLQTTAVTDEWHLISEPSVYVVDRSGTVTANFELIFSDAELTAALDAVK